MFSIDVVLPSLLITLNRFHIMLWPSHCWLWVSKCWLGTDVLKNLKNGRYVSHIFEDIWRNPLLAQLRVSFIFLSIYLSIYLSISYIYIYIYIYIYNNNNNLEIWHGFLVHHIVSTLTQKLVKIIWQLMDKRISTFNIHINFSNYSTLKNLK